jgi:hypothetical protein
VFNDDIREFYREYESYLERNEEYLHTFNADRAKILTHHDPILRPAGSRGEGQQPWLFIEKEVPEHPQDIFYARDMDKIQELFKSLVEKKIDVYHDNQRRKKKVMMMIKHEGEDVAAAAIDNDDNDDDDDDDDDKSCSRPSSHHLPRSGLVDSGAQDKPPSVRCVAKPKHNMRTAEAQKISGSETSSLGKKKRGYNPSLRFAKRSKESGVATRPTQQQPRAITNKPPVRGRLVKTALWSQWTGIRRHRGSESNCLAGNH